MVHAQGSSRVLRAAYVLVCHAAYPADSTATRVYVRIAAELSTEREQAERKNWTYMLNALSVPYVLNVLKHIQHPTCSTYRANRAYSTYTQHVLDILDVLGTPNTPNLPNTRRNVLNVLDILSILVVAAALEITARSGQLRNFPTPAILHHHHNPPPTPQAKMARTRTRLGLLD